MDPAASTMRSRCASDLQFELVLSFYDTYRPPASVYPSIVLTETEEDCLFRAYLTSNSDCLTSYPCSLADIPLGDGCATVCSRFSQAHQARAWRSRDFHSRSFLKPLFDLQQHRQCCYCLWLDKAKASGDTSLPSCKRCGKRRRFCCNDDGSCCHEFEEKQKCCCCCFDFDDTRR